MMRSRRMLTLAPAHEPLWVSLFTRRIMWLTEAILMVGIAVGVGTLAWGLPSSAYAQTRLSEEAEQDRWSLSPGAIELGTQVGGGFSVNEKTRFATEFALVSRLGYVFAEQGHVLPGSFEIVGDISG